MSHSQLSTLNYPLIREGYKLTEVGVIPEDWEVKCVSEFADVKTGPFGTLLKASEYSKGDGVPLISVGEIRSGFLKITKHTPRVCKLVTRRLPQYLLKKGDIVFGRKGGVDRSALISADQEGWFLGSDGMSIRQKGSGQDDTYISIQFQSSRVQNWIMQHAVGTTMASLNQGVLLRAAIPFPSTLAEQEAIATALSDADSLIESIQQLIAKKRHIKQGAMQDLLTGKRRIQGFENDLGYKQTEVGAIPNDWECSTLGSIGRGIIGLTYAPSDVSDHGTLVLRSSNVQKDQITYDDNVFVDMDVPTRAITQKNDILICVRNGSRRLIGKSAIISDQAAGSAFGAFMTVYRSDLATFVLHQFRANIIKRQINNIMGATINQITNKDLACFLIPIPPTKAEQEAITTVLSDMDEEITTLETKLTKARQIKQGMMSELLTGKIRLV